MNTLKLCDAVDWQIKLMGIRPQEANVIKTCIARYTSHGRGDGFSDKVKSLIYRLCDAIKGLFGHSDWQRAEQALAKHVYSYIPTFCRNFVKHKTHAQVHHLAGRALQFLIWENKQKLFVPAPIKSMVEGQLLAAKYAVSQAALKLFMQTLLFGLNMRGGLRQETQRSFHATPMNTFARQQHPLLPLIRHTATCLLS